MKFSNLLLSTKNYFGISLEFIQRKLALLYNEIFYSRIFCRIRYIFRINQYVFPHFQKLGFAKSYKYYFQIIQLFFYYCKKIFLPNIWLLIFNCVTCYWVMLLKYIFIKCLSIKSYYLQMRVYIFLFKILWDSNFLDLWIYDFLQNLENLGYYFQFSFLVFFFLHTTLNSFFGLPIT